jgi:DNA-binding NarL/FixJ family response regulator
MTDAIRVLIADDHALLREGVRALLNTLDEIEVIDEAATGREAVARAAEQKPDVVLMDISMPDLNGFDATERLRKIDDRIRVVILTIHSGEEYIRRALRAGASGFMLKGGTRAELETAIRSAASGNIYLSPSVTGALVKDYLDLATAGHSPLDRLTLRQREVLQLLAEGKNVKQIGYILGLSVKTVETHRAAVMERLNIRDAVGLIRYAARMGLVCLDS